MINKIINTVYEELNKRLEQRNILISILVILFVLAFVVRLYKIDNPVADWHSWRQADTAAVTRNFVKEGYTPLFPKFDSYNSLNEAGKDNPERYFFAELPIYNSIVYFVYKVFGSYSLEFYGRLVSNVFSSLTVLILFLLVSRFSSNFVAFFSAFLFAVNPFNVYYGRVIMPDAMHVFFGVLSLYFVKLWVDLPGKDKPDKDENDSKVYYRYIYPVLAGLSLAVCVLAKPYGLVLGAPILYLLWQRFGLNLLKNYMVYIFAAIVLTPFLLWRWHINNYPEGMFGTTWLFNQGDIRFTGAYFRWLIYDRMNRLIFATGGFVLFFIGLLKFSKKEGLFYYIWLAAIGVFFVVIAKGNVTHDYYQLPLVPIGCVFMAKGVEFLWLLAKDKYQQVFHVVISFVLIALMVAFGWYEVRGFFNVNRPEIVAAGKFIDENLPQDAKVIAPYMSDPAFLYQTNRYGWTIGGGKIRDFKEKEGATHLAIVNFDDDQKYWLERCKKIAGEENVWAVVDLRQCEGE